MARKEKQNKDLKWIKEIADKHGITTETVFSVYKSMAGKIYRDNEYISHKKRTEEFFDLYFEGVNHG